MNIIHHIIDRYIHNDVAYIPDILHHKEYAGVIHPSSLCPYQSAAARHPPDARRVEGEQHHGEGGEIVQLLRGVRVLGVEHGGPEPGVDAHLARKTTQGVSRQADASGSGDRATLLRHATQGSTGQNAQL